MKYFALLLLICLLAGVQSKTECEEHKERESKPGGNIPLEARLIPKCDKSGKYESLQCHPKSVRNTRACQCWSENGKILTPPRFALKSCSCILAAEKSKETRGATLLKCETDGTFERKQCPTKDSCFCVNKETGTKENC